MIGYVDNLDTGSRVAGAIVFYAPQGTAVYGVERSPRGDSVLAVGVDPERDDSATIELVAEAVIAQLEAVMAGADNATGEQ